MNARNRDRRQSDNPPGRRDPDFPATGRGEAPSRLQAFRQIIREDVPEVIEAARDWLQAGDLGPLIALYWQLEIWPQKRALVEILQDQQHPDLPEVMLDFLRAPAAAGDERSELAQAIALGFVEERYDRFMVYYNDRQRLARDVRAVLRQHGLQPERPPEVPGTGPERPQIPAAGPANRRLLDGAARGDLGAVQRALADGADIDAAIDGGDSHGCSALIMALIKGHFGLAAYLIERGADVQYKRPARYTADRSRGQTPLWWAASHGHIELARNLIERGADVNVPDHHGGTPLTQAAGSGHLDMVRYLVERGADVRARIYDGRQAFHLAVTHGHRQVAEYLLGRGNDPNERGDSGYTPLMVAAENNFYELARSLIQRGADVNAVHAGSGIYIGLRGWTPLVFAVQAGHVRMARLLLEAGADVHYQVPAGQNARGEALPARRVFDFARGKRAQGMLKLLREAGA